jgi:TfoX/Sxy family transcriptional regulator of competence genes
LNSYRDINSSVWEGLFVHCYTYPDGEKELPVPGKKTKQNPATADIDPRFRSVVHAFEKYREVRAGKMMSSDGLKVNGKVFAMFGRRQFVVKLPKARVDALVQEGMGKNFDPGHGRLMNEWVVVADSGPDWPELAKEAYEFVKTGKRS